MKKIISFIFLLFLSVAFINAYSSSDIQHMWSFSFNGDYVTFDDVQDVALSYSASDITLSYNNTITEPSLYFNNSGYIFNKSTYAFGSKPFSVSVWVNPYGGFTNLERYIILNWSGGTVKDYVRGSSVGTYFYINGVSKIANTSCNLGSYSWSLITLTYDNATNTFKLYKDATLCGSYVTDYNSSDGFGTGYISYGWIDDIILFNKSITADDVAFIYNGGMGRPTSEILAPEGTYDNLYLTYTDICYGTDAVCHVLPVINGTAQTCNITDMEYCYTMGCYDLSDYYYELGFTPASLNFNASCGIPRINNACILNTSICTSSMTYTRCINYNGINAWFNYTCPPTTSCQNGVCIQYANPPTDIDTNATDDIGHTTVETVTLWCPFFGIECQDSKSNQLLVAIIMTIVCICLGAGVIFSVTTTTGYKLPNFLTIGIMSIFTFIPVAYFITIGFLPFWIILVIIALIALVGGALFTSIITGGK